ncbi:MAG: hypothetical protein Q9208_006743 [Pyrenodesmia sp. 3 TL-2023]
MPSNTISLMAMAFALLSTTNAHMEMKTPSPFGAASMNNSPLDPSGSDFPCKQRPGVYEPPATKNVMPIGVPQTLSFKGSAVHGGGSCQISLSKDAKPTKESKWMVIHSIQGGCPAKAAGNLGDDANANVAAQFQYKIPPGIAPGEYTLAWTWFNKIGNREMYMNCAPITVTGGGKTRRDVQDCHGSSNTTNTYASDEIFKRDTSFPEMFKANMPSTDCETETEKDVKFPNPGQSVENAGDPSALAPPTGPKCGGAGASSSGSSPAVAAAGGSSGSKASSAPAASMPMASPSSAGSNTGASAAPAGAPSPSMTIQAIPPPGTGASTGAAAMQSVQSAAASVASAAASVASGMGGAAGPAPTASSSGASAGSSGASSGESSGAVASNATPSSGGSSSSSGGSTGAAMSSTTCSTPGQLVCSADGKMFGTCGPDKTAMMMPVASGTKCQGGKIGFGKRSAKYAKAYRA